MFFLVLYAGEDDDEISNLFLSMNLTYNEKELCEESKEMIMSKLLLHPNTRAKQTTSHIILGIAKVAKVSVGRIRMWSKVWPGLVLFLALKIVQLLG